MVTSVVVAKRRQLKRCKEFQLHQLVEHFVVGDSDSEPDLATLACKRQRESDDWWDGVESLMGNDPVEATDQPALVLPSTIFNETSIRAISEDFMPTPAGASYSTLDPPHKVESTPVSTLDPPP